MFSRISRSTLAAIAFATILAATVSAPAEKIAQNVIVIPARHAYLQLAVDVSRFHPTTVIGFRKNQAGEARLFIWVESKKGWSRLPMADYQSGAVFSGKSSRLVLVDADEAVPASLDIMTPAVKETKHIVATSIGDLVNQIAPLYKFSESDWRSIAKWNNLTLTDHNADRRKYGRWGKPDGVKTEATDNMAAPEEVHQGKAEVYAEPVSATPVTEYDEAEYIEPMPLDEASAPSALPVANVVSEQPETGLDPANK